MIDGNSPLPPMPLQGDKSCLEAPRWIARGRSVLDTTRTDAAGRFVRVAQVERDAPRWLAGMIAALGGDK